MLGLSWLHCVLNQLGFLLLLHLARRHSASLRSLTVMEMGQGIIGKGEVGVIFVSE